MQVIINGKLEEIEEVVTLKELVAVKNLPEAQVVIEVNGELASRKNWGNILLRVGDTIEILRFVGGG
jgi:sulfur carrier protein